ncbi:hypothetical protein D3C72_1653910 [compost metagenome]
MQAHTEPGGQPVIARGSHHGAAGFGMVAGAVALQHDLRLGFDIDLRAAAIANQERVSALERAGEGVGAI